LGRAARRSIFVPWPVQGQSLAVAWVSGLRWVRLRLALLLGEWVSPLVVAEYSSVVSVSPLVVTEYSSVVSVSPLVVSGFVWVWAVWVSRSRVLGCLL
jgi:hypothetical protein